MVGAVDHCGPGIDAERDDYQLGVHRVDQVDQAGATHRSRRLPQASRTWDRWAADAGSRPVAVTLVTIDHLQIARVVLTAEHRYDRRNTTASQSDTVITPDPMSHETYGFWRTR